VPPVRSLTTAADHGRPRRICAIHQPHYLPWLPYIDKMTRADVFVVLDDVQYTKNGWQNRNRLKGPQGPFTITVPVRKPYGRPISDVEIADDRWPRAHLNAVRTSYGRCPGFGRLEEALAPVLERPHRLLADLNWQLLLTLRDLLEIATPLRRSSEMNIAASSTRRLGAICAAVGATHYLTGVHAASAYLDTPLLERSGVEVLYHRWSAPEYDQPHPRAGFASNMSIIDLLAAAPDQAAELLARAGQVDDRSG